MADRRTLDDPARGPARRKPVFAALVLVSGLIALGIGWRYGLLAGLSTLIGLLDLLFAARR